MRYFISFILLVNLHTLQAQPAIYMENMLTVPQGAVLDADNPAYYNDIQFNNTGGGNFQLVTAQTANLVSVDTVVINIMESFPVQVSLTVTGNKSVPCVESQTPAIGRQDNLFIVVLAETTLGPAESCIAVLDPFETTFSLDVVGLTAGTYAVSVNGTEAEFTLDVDN
ncbi:MAG: hypothetical protein GKR91_15120 [Pseudomonadales bacterium]|nr:hypothetical protein [Pseudomonadales bacterium]